MQEITPSMAVTTVSMLYSKVRGITRRATNHLHLLLRLSVAMAYTRHGHQDEDAQI